MNNFDAYARQAYKDSKPVFTTIELTHKCNFSCKHCYNFDRTKPISKPLPSLNFDLVTNFLKELKDEGGLIVNFSGGEPLLHPKILELIQFTKSLNLIPRLKTNAFLLSLDLCKKLKKNGLDSVDISMYGFSNSTYTKFTNNPVGFDHFILAVKNLKNQEIRTQANIIITRDNFNELDEMVNFCHENNLALEMTCDISDRYDKTSPSKKDIIISDEQFAALLKGPHKKYFQATGKVSSFQCSCARSVCGLSVTGDIYPCIGAPIISGSILKDSFHNIWHNSAELNKIRNLTNKSFPSCVTCKLKDNCVRSSGEVFVNTGDYTGCAPQTYKKAQLRKKSIQ